MAQLDVDLKLDVGYNAAPLTQTNSCYNKNATVFSMEVYSGARGVPHIFSPAGGRKQECVSFDRRLHNVSTLQEYVRTVAQCLPKFDAGNAVIAFSLAAKLVEDSQMPKLKAHPVWIAQMQHLHNTCTELEPRGLSMVAYDLAKMGMKEERLLADIAAHATRRARDFGAKDIAKLCWALAKFGFFRAPAWEGCWHALTDMVPSKVHSGNVADCSMMAWAFATAGVGDVDMFREVAAATLAHEELPTQSLSNIAWAYGAMGMADDDLAETISARAMLQVDAFNEFEASDLCFGLAQMGAVDYELFDFFALKLVRDGTWKRLAALHASQVVWAYAAARYHHVPLFKALSEYIARHVAVFDTQHVAMFAWSFAVVGANAPAAFAEITRDARGGKLWSYTADQMMALFWSLAKRGWWNDERLFADFVYVARARTDELDGDSAANLLWALVAVRADPDLDASCCMVEIDALLDFILQVFLAGSLCLSDPETISMSVWAYCKLGRRQDARELLARPARTLPSPFSCYSPLLLDLARSRDAAGVAQVWLELAAISRDSTLRTAFMNAAALTFVRSEDFAAAYSVLRKIESMRLSNNVSRRLARSLGETGVSGDVLANGITWMPLEPQDSSDRPHQRRHELDLLDAVLSHCASSSEPGELVLAAMRKYGNGLETMLPGHDVLLEQVVEQRQPRVVLDLDSHVGYGSLLAALRCGLRGSVFVAIEPDPVRMAIAQSLWELAGVSSIMLPLLGPAEEWLPELPELLGGRPAEVAMIHNAEGTRLITDLEKAEGSGLLSGCTVVSDRALRPGMPGLLWHVLGNRRAADAELVAVVSDEVENWMLKWSCTRWQQQPQLNGGSVTSWQSADTPVLDDGKKKLFLEELESLNAESDALWRRALDPHALPRPGMEARAEQYVRRATAAFAGVGLLPTRHVNERGVAVQDRDIPMI